MREPSSARSRTSTSVPTTVPVPVATVGWNRQTSSFAAMARRRRCSMSTRSSSGRSSPSANSTTWPRPSAFARTRAMSACRMRSVGRVGSPAVEAMPPVIVTVSSWSPTRKSGSIDLRSHADTSCGLVVTGRAGCRIANSSPPRRTTTEPGTAWSVRRRPTSMTTSSPTPWPRLSLMTCSPSMSRSSRPTRPGSLRVASASSMRSMSAVRLGRPVSASRRACWRSSSSEVRSAVTSSSTRTANSPRCGAAAAVVVIGVDQAVGEGRPQPADATRRPAGRARRRRWRGRGSRRHRPRPSRA